MGERVGAYAGQRIIDRNAKLERHHARGLIDLGTIRDGVVETGGERTGRCLVLQAKDSFGEHLGYGEAVVMLTPEGAGTRLSYRYGVDLSGKVAAVGGRMLDGAARLLIAEFFKRLGRHAAPVEADATPTPPPPVAEPAKVPVEQRGWLRRLIGREKGGSGRP